MGMQSDNRLRVSRMRCSAKRCTADPGPPRTGTVHASRVYPTCAHWAPISGKPEIGVCRKTGKNRRSDQPARRSRLWKPHPEEARSAVSKDEASDPFALMLRDASQRASASEATCARDAPLHEGEGSAAHFGQTNPTAILANPRIILAKRSRARVRVLVASEEPTCGCTK
jgi:hypothetical protein